jgi:hypothetical protein
MAPPALVSWFRRFLSLCPTLVAVLWVAGVARFHGHEFGPRDVLILGAAAFALRILLARVRRPRALPPLPSHASAPAIAAIAALFVAVLAAVLLGALEWIAENAMPANASLGLRVFWHGACAFAAAYCHMLFLLTDPAQTARRSSSE